MGTDRPLGLDPFDGDVADVTLAVGSPVVGALEIVLDVVGGHADGEHHAGDLAVAPVEVDLIVGESNAVLGEHALLHAILEVVLDVINRPDRRDDDEEQEGHEPGGNGAGARPGESAAAVGCDNDRSGRSVAVGWWVGHV